MHVCYSPDAFAGLAEIERGPGTARRARRPRSRIDQYNRACPGEGLTRVPASGRPFSSDIKLVLISSAGPNLSSKPERRISSMPSSPNLSGRGPYGQPDAVARPSPRLALPGEPSETDAKSRGLRCLLAEDNRINQQLALAIFEKDGYQMHDASNGHAAVEAMQAGPFDVVLMDIQTPGMDGMEATRRIRALPVSDSRGADFFALTANAMEGVREPLHGRPGWMITSRADTTCVRSRSRSWTPSWTPGLAPILALPAPPQAASTSARSRICNRCSGRTGDGRVDRAVPDEHGGAIR